MLLYYIFIFTLYLHWSASFLYMSLHCFFWTKNVRQRGHWRSQVKQKARKQGCLKLKHVHFFPGVDLEESKGRARVSIAGVVSVYIYICINVLVKAGPGSATAHNWIFTHNIVIMVLGYDDVVMCSLTKKYRINEVIHDKFKVTVYWKDEIHKRD